MMASSAVLTAVAVAAAIAGALLPRPRSRQGELDMKPRLCRKGSGA